MRRLQYLLPYLKIDIVYEYMIHRSSVKQVSADLGLNYPTVLSVIRSYKDTGRIFKLLPYHSKLFVLKNRARSIECQKMYRKYRKNNLKNKLQ